ncbi:hypothetical protein FACS1894187_16060 [Synergistales bacterium]|nr:hypothetical protein FACS1894187_16060 [Synergistales bacterium]
MITPQNLDYIRDEDFTRDELAIDIIASMISMMATKIREARSAGDFTKAEEMESDYQRLRDERIKIYKGDTAIKAKVIKEYTPILKRHYTDYRAKGDDLS